MVSKLVVSQNMLVGTHLNSWFKGEHRTHCWVDGDLNVNQMCAFVKILDCLFAWVTLNVHHVINVFLSVWRAPICCVLYVCVTSPPSGVLKVTGSLLGPLPFLLKTFTESLYSEKGSRPGTMACVLFPGKDRDWRSSKILLGYNRLRFLNQWTCKSEVMDNGWGTSLSRAQRGGREGERQRRRQRKNSEIEYAEEQQLMPGFPFNETDISNHIWTVNLISDKIATSNTLSL